MLKAAIQQPAPSISGAEGRQVGAVLATAIEVATGQTRLRGRCRGRPVLVTVPIEPDERAARHLRAAVRRILRVTLTVTESGQVTAAMDVVGHRRAATRPIPVATALGLGMARVPVRLRVSGLDLW